MARALVRNLFVDGCILDSIKEASPIAQIGVPTSWAAGTEEVYRLNASGEREQGTEGKVPQTRRTISSEHAPFSLLAREP
jgi:hypothetical protein